MQELQLHDPYTLWYDQRPLVITFIIGTLFIVSLLIYASIRFYKKYKAIKKYTILEKTLVRLEELDTQSAASWYAQASAALKDFFQEVYGMQRGLTDQEIIVYIDTLAISQEDKKLLQTFFIQAMPAKFSAQASPLQGEFIPQIQAFLKKIWDIHIRNIKGNK